MGMGRSSTMTSRLRRSGPRTHPDTPPQEHDAKCGFACHTIVADKDYVFTAYPKR